MRDSRRDGLHGFSMDSDQLWVIHTKNFSAVITSYNDELTGYDPRLRKLDAEAFVYGGNAYYILGALSAQHEWIVEPVDDREPVRTRSHAR